MPQFNFVLRYVADPAVSAKFYAEALGAPVVAQSPGFAMLPLREGVMLGLWRKEMVEPRAPDGADGGEICLHVGADAEVDSVHADWKGRGYSIAQAPTKMDFGRTFVALDPDGGRIRVFCPAG
ncbi:MAG TPA: VOC family protein [Rhodoblastus sp.]|nr:VOC family protein [Rhodoblastus sp.]